MSKLSKLYRKTGWHTVFSFDDEACAARTYLLGGGAMTSIVSGLTSGILYTGFLLSYGINIVNLSILTLIPSLTSLFSLLTPYILDRFKSRRMILSAARTAYHAINIIGITVLPKLVTDPDARVAGLVVLVFLANAINYLFAGYNPWHMPYIQPEVRTAYYSATALLNNLVAQGVALGTSLLVDSMEPSRQLELFTVMRLIAFAVAALEVYLLQKPREPEYLLSTKPSLTNIIRLPLAHKRFRLTVLVALLYSLFNGLSSSVANTWTLQTVGASYTFQSVLNAIFPLFVLFTSAPWGKVLRRLGTFRSMALSLILLGISNGANAFVTPDNYLWLLAAVRLFQHGIGMIQHFATANLLYINLPKEDQTSFTSFYSIVTSLASFCGMSIGTWMVAAMGEGSFRVLGFGLGAVPVVLLVQCVTTVGAGIFTLAIRSKAEPEK